jgi:hypothetical protein
MGFSYITNPNALTQSYTALGETPTNFAIAQKDNPITYNRIASV